MKHIRLLFLAVLWMPASVFAHPGAHVEYSVITIMGHFFSQPDHLLMLVGVIALLWGVVSLRRLFLVRKTLSQAGKRGKSAP